MVGLHGGTVILQYADLGICIEERGCLETMVSSKTIFVVYIIVLTIG
jgi:hypothetical protein